MSSSPRSSLPGSLTRAIDDIFAIQDEITFVLATEMQVKLTEGELVPRYTTTTDVEAWTYWA